MEWRNGQDTISGTQGKVYASIDGRVHRLFNLKSLETSIELEVEALKILGSRATHRKVVGWTGEGSLEAYHMSDVFARVFLGYVKRGHIPNIFITVETNDPSSTVGRQVATFRNVIFAGGAIALLDAESVLEDSIDFTFEDYDITEHFRTPEMRQI